MRVGSVEYAVIAFPGNQFKGEIIPALRELIDQGTVRIIDIAFVKKDAAGEIVAMELNALGEREQSAFDGLAHEVHELLSEGDLQQVAESLEPNSSAGVIVWENAWSARFAEAVRNAGGVLVANERIPAAAVEAAIEENASPTRT